MKVIYFFISDLRVLKVLSLVLFALLFTSNGVLSQVGSEHNGHNHIDYSYVEQNKNTSQAFLENTNKLLPRFEENKGQWDSKVQFRAEVLNGYIYFENNQMLYSFNNMADVYEEVHHGNIEPDNAKITIDAFSAEFVGANENASISKEGSSRIGRNYFLGKKENWASGVKFYQTLKYEGIYDGIDLLYKSNENNVKYDVIVAPEADVDLYKVKYNGHKSIEIDQMGNLYIENTLGRITELKPKAYQIINGEEVDVEVAFNLEVDVVSFVFPNGYDSNFELVIDPYLVASTYTGSTPDNWGATSCPGQNGRMVVGGVVFGAGYPTSVGAYDITFNGAQDLSISIFSADGTSLIASTYLGGSANEFAHSIISASNGDVYIMGRTLSTDFPTTVGAFDASLNDGVITNASDIFIARLNSSLSSLLSSTYVGGDFWDGANGTNSYTTVTNTGFSYADGSRGQIKLDNSNNVYCASMSLSNNFPVTGGAYDVTYNGNMDGVVFKMNPSLTSMTYATYLGGGNEDAAFSLHIDASRGVYVAGAARGGFPTTAGVIDPTYNGNTDGFVAHLNSTGSTLLESTYLGTGNKDIAFNVDQEWNGDVYVYGLSQGGTYPVTGGVYSNAGSSQFIHSMNATLTTTTFSTVFGNGSGTPNISPTAFEVDSCGNIYACGWGRCFDGGDNNGMPTTIGAYQTITDGCDFYFLTLTNGATGLLYGSYFGQNGGVADHVDGGTSLFSNSGNDQGVVYQAACASCGGTASGFPTTVGAYSSTNNSSNCNNAVFKFDLETYAPGAAAIAAAGTGCAGTPVAFTNNSTNATSYLWNFGDGGTSTSTSPNHTYATAGTYNISLIAYNSTTCIGTDTALTSITIGDPTVTVSVTSGTNPSCSGSAITLSAAGANTYVWSPGGQTTSSITVNPVANTNYSVIGTETSSGCTDTDAINVTIDSQPTVANAGTDQSACTNPGSVTLAGNTAMIGSGTWTQTSGPAATITSASSPTSTVTGMSTAGTYVFEWSITNGNCPASTDQVSITVNATPNAPTAGSNSPICASTGTINLTASNEAGATYSWTGPNAFASATQNPSIASATTAMSGVYSVTTTVLGCTSVAGTVTVSVANCPPTANDDTAGSNLTEDGANGTINIITNDTDTDGTPAAPSNGPGQYIIDLDPGTPGIQTTYTNATGTWTYNTSTGVVTFDPANDYNGTATITYELTDPEGNSDQGSITFTVDPVNDAPSQGNETLTVNEDEPNPTTTVDLTTNNIDPDGTAVDFSAVVSTTGGGTITDNGDGTVDYTPALNFNGIDTVVYTVCDNGLPMPAECVNDTLFVTVTPINDAPSQGNETLTVVEDETNPTTTVDLTTNNIDPDGTVVDFSAVVSTTGGGTVTDNGDGTVDYTPVPNFNGVDTVIYTVCDNGLPMPASCVNDTLFVTVTSVNDAPSQGNETLTVNEDEPNPTTTVDLTTNNIDPDGTVVDFSAVVSTTGGGTVTDNGDGTVDYTPALNFNGIDTVVYTVCDNGLPMPAECVNDTLFVTVTPVNDAPSQGNETLTVVEDETNPTTTVDLTTNNIDPDGTVVDFSAVVSTTGGGTVTDNGDGTVDYTPALNFNGVDTVVYTVCDNGLPMPASCVNDTLFVTVTPVNDAPIVDNENHTTPEETPVSGDLTDAGDSDVDGNLVVTTTPLDGPDNGTIVINPDGTYTYTPNANFNGNDTIVVTICDDGTPLPANCTTDTVFVTVTPVNDAPSQGNETLTVVEDEPTPTTTVDLTTNNIDPDGTVVDFSAVVSTTGGGTITDNGDGTVDYTPAPNFNGVDTVVYTVCDNGLPMPASCVNDTLFVTVTPVNDAPSQGNETLTVNEDEPNPTTTVDLTTNNIDPDGTVVDFSAVVSTTGGGTITDNGDGTVDYTPAPNFNGVDTVVYTVCDNGLPMPASCVNDTLFVTVVDVNDPPVATDNNGTTNEDTPITINVTGDDTDVDGTVDASTVDLDPGTPGNQNTVTTADGIWTVDGSGNVTFTPNLDFNGVATIDYNVEDDDVDDSNNATITITVTPINDAPIVDNENHTTPEETPVSGDLTDAGDSDVDGNLVVTTTPLDGPDNGSIVINPDGTYTYTPNANFNGNDTIVVTICDDGTPLPANCTTDTIFVTVTPVNDAPSQGNETLTVVEDETNPTTTVDLTTNNIDPDGTVVDFSAVVSTTGGGTVTDNGDGTVDYTPAPNFNGVDTVIYTVCDNGLPMPASCVNDTLFVTVTPVNDAPSQGNETLTVSEDEPNPTTTVDLTTNNIDPDGTVVDFSTVVSTTGGGTVTDNGDGTVDYTPAPNFNGIDTVVYTVCDNGLPMPAECVNDTLFVTVVDVNDPPVATDNNGTTNEDTPITINVTGDDTDVDGTVDASTVDLNPGTPGNQNTVTTADGTWTVDGSGNVTFTPNLDFNGVATIDYNVEDDDADDSNNATITITVTPINDAPIVDNENHTTPEETPVSGDLTDVGDSDVDGNLVVTTTPLDGPDNGSIVINPDGTYTYTPNANFNGNDTIVVTICDDGTPLPVNCTTDTIFVTVTPVNDAPSQGNETLTVVEDETNPTTTVDLTTNNIDPDGTVVDFSAVVSTTGGGTVTDNGDGTVDYTPAPNFNGVDTVIYTVCDNGLPMPASCVNDTLFVTITPVNDAPSQGNETLTVNEDEPNPTTTVDLTTNNIDPDGTVVDFSTVVSTTGGGTITDNGDGTVDYTPAPNFNGIDTVVYTVCDNGLPMPASCVNDTLFVTVNAVNDPPVVDNEFISVPVNGSNSGDLTDAGDSDVDGNLVVTTTPLDGPDNGSIVINPDGTFTYTPNAGYVGQDTVVVTICDDGTPLPIACTTDTIFINVLPTNPPVATDNNATTLEDNAVTFNITGDDTDSDGTIDNGTVDLDPGTVGIQSTFTDADGNVWTVDANGDVTFTPALDYNGTATIDYTVNDNDGATSNTATLTVTVTPVNDAPIVDNENITTPEETPISGDLTDAGDSDVDGNLVVTTTPLDGPDNGTIVINTDGTYTYTPDPDFNGVDTVVVTICDDGTPLPANCTTDTIFVTVTPVNDPPVATDNNGTTTEDNAVTINVTGDDSDIDGTIDNGTVDLDPTTPGIDNTYTDVDGNVWTVDANGDVTFTPAQDYNGTATIDYTVNDNDGAISNVATITIVVDPVNDPPVVDNEYISVPLGGSTSGDLTDLGDTDVDGNLTATITPLSGPSNGTVLIFPDGSYTYTGNPGFIGMDTVIVEICDDGTPTPIICVTDTIFVTILNTLPPVATDNNTTTTEDNAVTINVTGDDSDPDGTIDNGTVDLDPGTPGIQSTYTDVDGNVWTVDANGDVTFTPAQDYNGTAVINYTVNDNDGSTSNTATITVVVDPINDAPVVDNENITTPEDTPINGDLTDTGDSDVDGNLVVSVLPLDGPDNGTIVINPDGTYTYTPNPDFNGQDTVVVQICDDGTPLPVICTTDTIFIDVTPVNDPPIVDNEFISVPVNGSSSGDLTDVGDSDSDGNLVVTTTPVDGPDNGSIVINPDGTYTYTPTPGYLGNDTVVVTICDDGTPLPIECTTDTIFIEVVNTIPPVATDNNTTTLEDVSVTINVTGDDTDADGTVIDGTVDLDPGTPGIQSTYTDADGNVWTVDANGDVTFTPAQDYNGTAVINYTVEDNDGATSNTATITVVVTPVDDNPIATDNGANTLEDTPVTFNVTGDDTDSDGTIADGTVDLDPTTVGTQTTVTTAEGTWTVDGNGNVTFTPALDFNGTATIDYTVEDNDGLLSNVATITVTVDPVNDAPIVDNENIITPEDTPVSGDLTDAGDSDVDGNLVVNTTPLDGPDNGTIVINPDGTYTYTPNPEFGGMDTVIVEICDDGTPLPANCTTDTIFIDVTPINDAPIVDNEFISVPVGGSNGGDLTDNGDSDVDGNLVVNTTPLDGPDNGTIVINPDGTYTYTNTNTSATNDTIVVEICDDGTPLPINCTTDTIFINILNTTPPIATDNNTTTPEDNAVTINVTGDDTDSDGTIDNGTVDLDPGTPGIQTTITTAEGIWTVDANGDVTFTPNQNYNGTATIDYTVNDNDGATSNTATITVVVTPVNDGPIVDNENNMTPEDTPVSGDLTDAGDSDVDGNLVVNTTPIDGPDNGTIVINPDGTYTYTPDPDFNGSDTIVVTICDDGTPLPAMCTTDTIIVTVTPVNDAPIVDNEFISVPVGGSNGGDLTDLGDSDVDGNLVVNTTPLSGPNEGTIVINPDGTYTYTNTNPTATNDTIVVEICDDGTPLPIICTTDTIFINILNTTPPVATDNNTTTNEDTSVTINVTGDDTDADGTIDDGTVDLDPGTPGIQSTYTDADGNVWTVDANGDVTFTPAQDYNGTAVINYTVNDNDGATSNTATITVVVTPVNDAPIVDNENVSFPEDTSVSGDLTDAGDSDVDGNLVVNTTPIDGPDNGTIVINTDGTYTYTPDPNFNGLDTVVVEICDDAVPTPLCVNDTIFLIVTPVNDSLVVDNEYHTTTIDNPVSGDLTDAGDFDIDGNMIVNTTPIGGPNNGTITINTDGTYTYTPNTGYVGLDTVLVEICDDGTPIPGICVTDTIFIEVINCDLTVATDDCDNDGLNNGEETTGVDDPNTPNTPNGNTSDPLNPDTDGDGVTDGIEGNDGTDPNNPCELVFASQDVAPSSAWNNTDCDNDGLTNEEEITGVDNPNTPDTPNGNTTDPINPDTDGDGVVDGTEGTDGTDPNNPCDLVAGNITVTQGGDWDAADCDGDGVTNGQEVIDLTDPNNPCELIVANQTLPTGAGWNDADCDNDGLTNGEETTGVDDPNTSDTPNGNTTDPTNPDTDGDGVVDGTEGTDGTDPNNPCDLIAGNITVTQGGDWDAADCDGDGVTNGQEVIDLTDPNNPCELILANQDTTPDQAWNDADCDNDGLTNEEEATGVDNPNTPNDPNGNVTDPLNPDSDGDGVTDGQEAADGTDPNNPCDLILANQDVTPSTAWNDTDCDNDGLTNEEEITGVDDPNTSDTPNGNVTDPFNNDTDGDGVIDGTEGTDGTDPNDPCDNVEANITEDVTSTAPCGLFIPEAFSPNGDEIHDVFVINGIENYPNSTFLILNRWGNKVFEATGYQNDWGGTNQFGVNIGGETLPVGTYFYILDLGEEGPEEDGKSIYKGYIYLNR